MSTLGEYLAIVLFFVLRLAVPVALTGGIAWWLRRLDARWRSEAEADSRTRLELLAATTPQLEPAALAKKTPCWELRNCPQERRDACAAYRTPALPCWLVRNTVEGVLPAGCATCSQFQSEQAKVLAA